MQALTEGSLRRKGSLTSAASMDDLTAAWKTDDEPKTIIVIGWVLGFYSVRARSRSPGWTRCG